MAVRAGIKQVVSTYLDNFDVLLHNHHPGGDVLVNRPSRKNE